MTVCVFTVCVTSQILLPHATLVTARDTDCKSLQSVSVSVSHESLAVNNVACGKRSVRHITSETHLLQEALAGKKLVRGGDGKSLVRGGDGKRLVRGDV